MLIVGLVLILVGANGLTDGASALARRWGVSDLMIGLTVVAFGTSAPELTISIVSSIQHSPGLAVGNVVGSNIFNIAVIIGVVAMVRPIKVQKSVLQTEIPYVLLSSVALMAIGMGNMLGVPGPSTVGRPDGILLILFFLIFLRYTFSRARIMPVEPGDDTEEKKAGEAIGDMPLWKSLLWVGAGLAMLVFGGDWFVKGASGIASSLGVSDAIIGLTIVAAGTSLPELATSLAAAVKGKTGIAIGNVIGSCIFNAFLVLGAAAAIYPLPFGDIGLIDLATLVVVSILFWIFGRVYKEREITRPEGALLFLIYVGYIVYLVFNL